MKKNYDLVMLFSGGADSVMMFDLASTMKLKSLFLMIDYGQLHNQELEYAKNFLLNYNSLQHSQTVSINNLLINSGLTGNGKKNIYENVNPFYVPSRNLMFVSIAASIAEANGIEKIWHGADYSDRINLFPDCYQEWVVKVNELLKLNSNVQLECPLMGFSKESILDYLKQKEYNMEFIFSGYGELED